MSEEFPLNNSTRQRISQLAHDIRDELFVLEMGLEALKGIQNDPERFAAVVEEIRRDGVRSIQESITLLLDMVRNQQ